MVDRHVNPPDPGPRAPSPLVRFVLVPLAVVAALAAGVWLLAGRIAPGYATSIALAVAWFAVVRIAIGRLGRRAPATRNPARAAFATFAIVALAGFWWTSIREVSVDEQVVEATPRPPAQPGDRPSRTRSRPRAWNVELAAGPVESLAHSGRGRAAIVELPSGERKLTLREFDIDPGPEVVVRLVAGDVRGDGDVEDFRDLGGLKGSRGNQQYDVPRGVDLDRYRTVVFWCVPFSQALARARLDGVTAR